MGGYLDIGVHGADHGHVVHPGSEDQERADGVHGAVYHVRLLPSHDVEDQHLKKTNTYEREKQRNERYPIGL